MNKNNRHSQLKFALGLASALAGSATLAWAAGPVAGATGAVGGTVNGAVGAAGGAVNGAAGATAGAAGNLTGAPGPSSASGNAASGASGAVNGAVGGVNAGVSGAGNSAAGATSGAVPNANTNTNAGGDESLGAWRDRTQGQQGASASNGSVAAGGNAATNGANGAAGVNANGQGAQASSGAAAGSVDAGAISNSSFESREQLRSQINSQIEANNRAMTATRQDASKVNDQSEAAFRNAQQNTAAREQQLRSDLEGASNATADNWNSVRSKLAADQASYQEALENQRAAATASGRSMTGADASGSASGVQGQVGSQTQGAADSTVAPAK